MVCLIKPQFEAGKEKVGKKGVVRDPEVHSEVVHRIFDFMGIAGFEVLHLDFSPIKGPEGNIEYLIHIRKDASRNAEVEGLSEADGEKKLLEIQADKSGISFEKENNKLIEDAVLRAAAELK